MTAEPRDCEEQRLPKRIRAHGEPGEFRPRAGRSAPVLSEEQATAIAELLATYRRPGPDAAADGEQ